MLKDIPYGECFSFRTLDSNAYLEQPPPVYMKVHHPSGHDPDGNMNVVLLNSGTYLFGVYDPEMMVMPIDAEMIVNHPCSNKEEK